jgi:hypothetical protein
MALYRYWLAMQEVQAVDELQVAQLLQSWQDPKPAVVMLEVEKVVFGQLAMHCVP